MNHSFSSLPEQLRNSLNRWYLFSSIAFAVTLLTLSGIHIITMRCVYTLRSRVHITSDIHSKLNKHTNSEISKQLERYKKEHLHLYEALQHILPSVPETIYLTQLSLEPMKQVIFSGHAKKSSDITEFIAKIGAIGYLTLVQLSNEPLQKDDISFHIRLAYNQRRST